MRLRLTQVDGALPNLALMKLAHYHRSQRDDVYFTHSVDRDRSESDYDRVYASVLFDFSADRLARLRSTWPHAIVGGTGAGSHCLKLTVEELTGSEYEHYDYS